MCMYINISHHIPKPQFFINYTPRALEKKQNKTTFKRGKESLVQEEAAGIRVRQDDTHGRARSRRQGAELTHSLLL